MPDIVSQTKDSAKSNNWLDNLLIKDKEGKFSYYKKDRQIKPDLSSKAPDIQPLTPPAPTDIDREASEQDFVQDDYAKFKLKADSPANFYFHPDDQKDLAELSKNLPQDNSKKYAISKIVARIIEKQNLDFDNENKKIFTQILFNFFRSRKNVIVVRQEITEKLKINGRSLPAATIDALMSIIKGIKAKIEAVGGLVVEEVDFYKEPQSSDEKLKLKTIILEDEPSAEEPQQEIDKALGQIKIQESLPKEGATEAIKDDGSQKEINKKEKVEDPQIQQESEKPMSYSKIAVDSKDESQNIEVKINTPAIKSQDFSIPPADSGQKLEEDGIETDNEGADSYLPKVNRPLSNMAAKKQLADVVSKPTVHIASPASKVPKVQLTGPVGELQSMNLVGFRRLGKDAKSRTDKIFDKINLLEQDSFTKKAQGIKAWRESEIYQVYLQLGTESMSKGKQIGELINDYKAEGKDTLDIDEFQAITDLNQKIRF